MMATLMSMMIPRAAVSAGRITEVLDTETSVVIARPTRWRADPRPGRVELRRRRLRLPGAEAPCCTTSRSSPSRARRRRSSAPPVRARRRCSTSCPGCSTSRGAGARRRCRRARGRPGRPVGRTRTDPAASLPVLGTVASNLRYGDPDATDESCGRPCASPRPRTSCGRCRRARGPDRPGRHQRLRRSAAAARDRPGPRERGPTSISSTTPSRPRRRHRRPVCGPRCARSPATPRSSSSPSASRRSSTPTRSSSSTTGASSGSGTAYGIARDPARPTSGDRRVPARDEEAA
jgi:hypothetical protein